jgi:ABC-2 type transport system ATP-binding protein
MRLGMWDFLRKLNAAGTTIILTTHYLDEAQELCRNVAIINKGDILVNEPMDALLARHDKESLETVYLELTRPQ